MSTIAFIGPGDLATRLAAILAGAGHATLTTLEGRGARSRALCEERGLTAVDTLAEAVERAGIVICAVPPEAVLDAARAFMAALPSAGPLPVYVDANSVSPALAREVADMIGSAGAHFVSASVLGSGDRLGRTGQLFLSGSETARVTAIVGNALRVVELGSDPGRAKELKLLVAGMNKGLSALWVELGAAATRAGLLDEAADALGHAYPAMMGDLARLLPSYGRHAPRRIDELEALAAVIASYGVEPTMARATLGVVARIADDLRENPPPKDGEQWTWQSLIRRLAQT